MIQIVLSPLPVGIEAVIVIKVEIWPNGDESKAREHSRAYIANDGKTVKETKGAYESTDKWSGLVEWPLPNVCSLSLVYWEFR
ncbi:hypothetical protein LEP1GSC096_0054 [Leptospira interrogans serovar Hebdomadis str. R499]|nr:hypothetical protein LEP1GSC096_0054 [Leptospira interrogans serovar Hebdomadis str. R499]